jgi:hypothetical protein
MNWKHWVVTLSLALNVGLLAVLLVGHGQPAAILVSESYGQNRAIAGGAYAATTAAISSNRQALWVIDNQEKRLVVYLFPSAVGRRLEPIAARDLRKDFGEALAGDLMCIPGALGTGAEDAVYVFDPVGKKLIVYCSKNGKDLEVIGGRDLAIDFKK